MRKCRTCRLEKINYTKNYPHCDECITKYKTDWQKRNGMSLVEFLDEEPPVGGGVIPNYPNKSRQI